MKRLQDRRELHGFDRAKRPRMVWIMKIRPGDPAGPASRCVPLGRCVVFSTSEPERPLPSRHQAQQPSQVPDRPGARRASSSATKSGLLQGRPLTRSFDNAAGRPHHHGANQASAESRSPTWLKASRAVSVRTCSQSALDYSAVRRSFVNRARNSSCHQCGLPKRWRSQLFKRFIYGPPQRQGLFVHPSRGQEAGREGKGRKSWDIFGRGHPRASGGCLNRAPTLHRLGIQGLRTDPGRGQGDPAASALLHGLQC